MGWYKGYLSENTEIADNCIVAATSTVCGKHLQPDCTIGGVSAKVIKENINWCRENMNILTCVSTE